MSTSLATDDNGVARSGGEPEERTGGELRLMARALAGLYAAGATLALLTLLLPHSAEAEELGVVIVIANAYLVAALLAWRAGEIPARALAVMVAIGTVHITAVCYFSAERPSPLLLFYLWIFLYSSYYYSRSMVVAQVGFAAANLAVLLVLREPTSGAEAWWLVGIGAMLVAAALVIAMRERGERLIASLNRTARERERARAELSIHRDHLELLVEERTAALQVAYRELESFNYSVSHDLRAPLRGLDGFSQALLEDYGHGLPEEGRDYLRRIRAASQRMSTLIDDMLQLSRLARIEMRREPVDLSALAAAVGEELRDGEPDRDVELRIEPGVVAEADGRLIRVVLQNLIGNAWKFSSTRPRATVEFGRTTADGELAYFVRDDGVGFAMDYVDKLFGAFQRLHSAGEFEGTGIGLATVQRVVHRHGGRVWAHSAPDRGATFYFTLTSGRKADGDRDDPAG